jgi:hypothetical protein
MHLVGMLLTVAVGSNYGLFFQRRPDASPIEPRTLASLLVANLTTLTGFGVLATSQLPILKAIGATVAPGVVLALVFSAVLAAPQAEDHGRHRPLNRRAPTLIQADRSHGPWRPAPLIRASFALHAGALSALWCSPTGGPGRPAGSPPTTCC